MSSSSTNPSGGDLYLDLMAKVLTRYGFEGHQAPVELPPGSYEDFLWNTLRETLGGRDVRVMERGEFDAEKREVGLDWPADAESMVGLRRLANVRQCVESVLEDDIPGDLIETGVWRGGASIYMRAVLKSHGCTDRTVWVADSFEGLPPPDDRFEQDAGDIHHTYEELAISLEEVQENFRRYDLLDEQVRFVKGFFEDSLPTAPVEHLSVLRLDGDMYSSTMDALNPLYDKLSAGGYVIIDDYGLPNCAAAINDFREERGITDPIEEVDWTGRFWRKS